VRESVVHSCYLAGLAALLRVRRIVVLGVYWDESWSEPRKDVFALGGYVFSPEGAAQFCQRWQESLDAVGLERFHMTDFLAREEEPYRSWSDEFGKSYYTELLRGYLKTGMRTASPAEQEVRNGERAGGAGSVADDLAGAG